MKLKIKIFLLATIVSLSCFGQNATFSGIKKIGLKNFKAIIENNEIKGYFMFYFLDKASKKENIYGITMLDNNLKQVANKEIKLPKSTYLIDCSYNDSHFCFAFLQYNDRKVEYMIFDKMLNSTGKYEVSGLSRAEADGVYTSSNLADEDNSALNSGGMAPITGKGFIRYGMEKEDGQRIEMDAFDNTGKKIWSANSNVTTKKSYEASMPIYSNDKIVLSRFITRPKLLSMKDIQSFIVMHDANTGKELSRLDEKVLKYAINISDVIYDKTNDQYILSGDYVEKGEVKSEGIHLTTISSNGTVKSENYASWKNEISKLMPMDKKGKIEDNFSIYIHKITPTQDGKYFVVGEQYKKAVSGVGVASAILTGGRGGTALTKLVVEDLMVFEFDNSLKIKNITIINKEKSSIQLPQGAGINGTATLGHFIKLFGGFDYAFLISSVDRKTFTSSYLDYDKEKGEANNYVIGTVSYNKEQKLISDKFRLSTKPTDFSVLPAKAGYIAVFEYYKKEKKVDVRLEKLNI